MEKASRKDWEKNPEKYTIYCTACNKPIIFKDYRHYCDRVNKINLRHHQSFCSQKCANNYKKRYNNIGICEYCGKEFIRNCVGRDRRNKHIFCSQNCSASFNNINRKRNIKQYSICLNCGKEYISKKGKKYCSQKCANEYKLKQYDIKIENGENVSHQVLRSYYLRHYDRCMNTNCKWDWENNKEENPTLQLHHIDGNHLNNTLDNTVLLCPNCHSLTDNYGFKNSHKSTRTYRSKYYKNN